MKTIKTFTCTLLVGVAFQQIASSQPNTNMLDIGGSPGNNQPVVLNAVTDTGTNATEASTVLLTNTMGISATNDMAAGVSNAQVAATAGTNAAAATPPIHFEDVP